MQRTSGFGKDANTPVAFVSESLKNCWRMEIRILLSVELLAGNAGNEGAYVSVTINGKFMNMIHQCTVSNGFVGIQSEGADF